MLRTLGTMLMGLLALLLPAGLCAQALLIPSSRAPYSAKFDLTVPDASHLFLPQAAVALPDGPYRFRFVHPALNELLDNPATVNYLTAKDGGFQLEVFHLRPADLAADALGAQDFWIEGGAGEVAGFGTLLVVTRSPEPIDLASEDGTRIFEVGRPARVRLLLRTHQNFENAVSVLNRQDFQLWGIARDTADGGGTVTLHGMIEPLRAGATELRLGVSTLDGRDVELSYGGLLVREPQPHRISVAGGPIYLDGVGRGSAGVVIDGFPAELTGVPVVLHDAEGELMIAAQSYDPANRRLSADLEFTARRPRQAGARELLDLVVQAGAQPFRGHIEVVGAPVVASAQTEHENRAVVAAGGSPVLLRIAGENLEGLRLDCSALDPVARCENQGSAPTQLVEKVSVSADAREGEFFVPLVATSQRGEIDRPYGAGVRLHVVRPAIPHLLTATGLLELNCGELPSCQVGDAGESMRVSPRDAFRLQLMLDEELIPASHGWQRLVVTVTRVRGEQRQTIRSFGSASAPRNYRAGLESERLPLLDAATDPRHGDQFVIRVEHAVEQYAAEYRTGTAAADAFVRRVFVDGGRARRLTGDIAVQPVLLRFGGDEEEGGIVAMYPNAGVGITWQFLDHRLEPRAFSTKLQLLATDITNIGGGKNAAQPAAFLSANLRIPGTDPGKPLVVTTGVAYMLGDPAVWRILAGAGMDLGIARLIFGR